MKSCAAHRVGVSSALPKAPPEGLYRARRESETTGGRDAADRRRERGRERRNGATGRATCWRARRSGPQGEERASGAPSDLSYRKAHDAHRSGRTRRATGKRDGCSGGAAWCAPGCPGDLSNARKALRSCSNFLVCECAKRNCLRSTGRWPRRVQPCREAFKRDAGARLAEAWRPPICRRPRSASWQGVRLRVGGGRGLVHLVEGLATPAKRRKPARPGERATLKQIRVQGWPCRGLGGAPLLT